MRSFRDFDKEIIMKELEEDAGTDIKAKSLLGKLLSNDAFNELCSAFSFFVGLEEDYYWEELRNFIKEIKEIEDIPLRYDLQKRLYSASVDFRQAMESIRTAIDLDDDAKKDTPITFIKTPKRDIPVNVRSSLVFDLENVRDRAVSQLLSNVMYEIAFSIQTLKTQVENTSALHYFLNKRDYYYNNIKIETKLYFCNGDAEIVTLTADTIQNYFIPEDESTSQVFGGMYGEE